MNWDRVIYCLHGFLGGPHDWDLLDWNPLLRGPELARIEKVDLAEIMPPSYSASPAGWARVFNHWIGPQGVQERILLGYSMGGRLAMQALLQNPELYRAAVLVSANPGIENRDDRPARVESDEKWARRFETEEWGQVLSAWESLPAFCGRPLPFDRPEPASRTEIAACLRQWSLGRQENLLPRLAELPMPLLWIAGEDDHRYVELGEKLKRLNPRVDLWIAPKTGHRVPWEAPNALIERVHQFLEKSS